MSAFWADLHVHAALSPCAENEMTPPAIVEAALRKGLSMIAICDHNAAGNVAAVQSASPLELAVLAGIEITTAEEIHVLGLLPDVGAADATAGEVTCTLPERVGESRRFGEQLLMNADGDVAGTEPRMLSAASSLSLREAVELIGRHGGVAIAAHVDKPYFSVVSQLGVFPEDPRFDAVEVSAAGWRAGRWEPFAALGLPMLVSSDSHFLSEIGTAATLLEMDAPGFGELSRGLGRIAGRRISDA